MFTISERVYVQNTHNYKLTCPYCLGFPGNSSSGKNQQACLVVGKTILGDKRLEGVTPASWPVS